MQLSFIFLLFFNTLFGFHPFHVSVCDIRHNEDNRSLQITQKIFLDDLEEALKPLSDEKLDLFVPANLEKNSDLISQYIAERFQVYVNGKPKAFKYLGHEKDDASLWCYMEIEGVKKIKEIEVESRLLLETYKDQTNLVHVEYKGELKSMRLNIHQTTDKLSFK